MPDSYLQEEFLRVFAEGHRATAKRLISRLIAAGIPTELEGRVSEIVDREVRGLYHGNLVIFDGGSRLADQGLLRIVDDEGTSFVRNMHEMGLRTYDEVG